MIGILPAGWPARRMLKSPGQRGAQLQMLNESIALVAMVGLAGVSLLAWRLHIARRREAHIQHFAFPKGVFAKVIARHPHLSLKDMELVAHGLRQFFMAYLKSEFQHVSMPSQVADDLWHEFILYTRHYQAFSRQAFGRFLHHTPAVVLAGGQRSSNAGLRRCWWHVCREENINPRKPSRLPLLFALDTKFKIANGYHYVADCHGPGRRDERDGGATHCGGDFSDNTVDGGSSGFGHDGAGQTSSSHDSSPDGFGADGGDGGGGCGGGD